MRFTTARFFGCLLRFTKTNDVTLLLLTIKDHLEGDLTLLPTVESVSLTVLPPVAGRPDEPVSVEALDTGVDAGIHGISFLSLCPGLGGAVTYTPDKRPSLYP